MAEMTLPVMESFYTIQGEGHNQGKAAFFIRLGGCDIGCVWCDVKESWPAEAHMQRTMAEICDDIRASGAPNVVITGGEPSLYDLTNLTAAIKKMGLMVWIETAGTNALKGYFDWICVSPKKFKPVLPENLAVAHELKVIVYHKSDLDWAKTHQNNLNKSAKLYLQPEWSKEHEMLPLIIDFVKTNPVWQISLQTHKYMNIP